MYLFNNSLRLFKTPAGEIACSLNPADHEPKKNS
jgi:hypothetical protein